MTEEDFLTRWSRRKREIAKAEAEPEPRTETTPTIVDPEPDAKPADKAEFDLASLPPIESINALTDVTAFLRAGVPAELTRAALRRVWTADPAIRDFVGLAENAWDFTDPNAMPGFGPLESTEDIRRMIASIVDQIGEAVRSAADSEQSASDSKELGTAGPDEQLAQTTASSERAGKTDRESLGDQVLVQSNNVDIAPQRDVAEGEEAFVTSPRRPHGGALPR